MPIRDLFGHTVLTMPAAALYLHIGDHGAAFPFTGRHDCVHLLGPFACPNQSGKETKMMNAMKMVAVGAGMNGVERGSIIISGGVGIMNLYKPTAIDGAVSTVVEAAKEVSAEVISNAHITLRELKAKIASTAGVELPGFKELQAMNSPVVAEKEINGATLTVHENGFASYEQGERHTVLRVDECGDYRYQYSDGYEVVPAEVFEEAEWAVRLVMEGESRLERSRQVSADRQEPCYLECDGSDILGTVVIDFMEEQNRQMLADEELKRLYAAISKLTERQQQVIRMYYFDGLNQYEIADELGMRQQSVDDCIKGALKKLRRIF